MCSLWSGEHNRHYHRQQKYFSTKRKHASSLERHVCRLLNNWCVCCCFVILPVAILYIALSKIGDAEFKFAEKRAEELFQLVLSDFNQRSALDVPFVSAQTKIEMGDWGQIKGVTVAGTKTNTWDSCEKVHRIFLAVGMRVPKSASSTLQDLVDSLSLRNHYARTEVVQRHAVRGLNRTFEEVRLASYLSSLRRRTVWTSHVPFLDFAAMGLPRPVYFSTIRDPIKRLASHYNYEHFSAERPFYMQAFHQDRSVRTFSECLADHMLQHRHHHEKDDKFIEKDVHVNKLESATSVVLNDIGEKMATEADEKAEKASANLRRNPHQKVSRQRGQFDCLQTAGLQVRFFCGVSERCRQISWDTLQHAIRNIDTHFTAVVVVEDMLLSFRVLETKLPSLFHGLVAEYLAGNVASATPFVISRGKMMTDTAVDKVQGTRSRVNTAEKALAGSVETLTRDKWAFLTEQRNIQIEMRLYNHTRHRLNAQAKSCAV